MLRVRSREATWSDAAAEILKAAALYQRGEVDSSGFGSVLAHVSRLNDD